MKHWIIMVIITTADVNGIISYVLAILINTLFH